MGYGIFPESNDELCDYDRSTNECDYESYGLYIGLGFLLPGVVVGFVIMTVGLLLMTCYACCRQVKNRRAQRFNVLNYTTPEFFGFGKRPPFSNGWVCRVLLIILAILAALCFLAGLGVSVDVRNHTSSFRSNTEDFADAQVNSMEVAIDAMEQTSINGQLSPVTQPLYETAYDVIDDYNNYSDKAKLVEYIPLALFIAECVLAAWMVLMALLACVGAISGWRPILLCFIFLGLLTVFPLSGFFSYCIASEALYGDFCHDNDVTLAYGNSALKNGILPCDGSDADDLRTEINDVINSTQEYSCDYVNDNVCAVPGVNCAAVDCTLQNINNVPNQILVQDTLACGDPSCPPGPCTGTVCYSTNITLTTCASNCLNSTLRNLANATVALANDAQVFSDQLYNVFLPIVNCIPVRQYVVEIDDDLCTGMIRIGIVGILSLIAVAVFLVAIGMALLADNAIAVHKQEENTEFVRDKGRRV